LSFLGPCSIFCHLSSFSIKRHFSLVSNSSRSYRWRIDRLNWLVSTTVHNSAWRSISLFCFYFTRHYAYRGYLTLIKLASWSRSTLSSVCKLLAPASWAHSPLITLSRLRTK
jgi:hypothetical protein